MDKWLKKRPYTALQLWEENHKKISKAAIQASLTGFASKLCGKTLVYYEASTSSEDVWTLHYEQIPSLQLRADKVEASAARREQRARQVAAQPTNDELDNAPCNDDQVLDRLAVLSSRTFVPRDRLQSAVTRYNTHLRKWTELRRVVRTALAVINEQEDDVDHAHLAGVFDDDEAHVANPPLPLKRLL